MSNIMCSAVGSRDVVTFDLGVNKRGDPVYRVSWYRDGKWACAHYKTFEAAHATWKMINKMI